MKDAPEVTLVRSAQRFDESALEAYLQSQSAEFSGSFIPSKTSQAEAKLVTKIGPSPWKSNGEALSNCRHALLVMRSLTTRATSQSRTCKRARS